MLVLALGFMAGARSSVRLADSCAGHVLIIIGLSLIFLASLFLLLFNTFYGASLLALMIALTLFMFGTGFVYPNT